MLLGAISTFLLVNKKEEKIEIIPEGKIVVQIQRLDYGDDIFNELNQDDGYIIYDNGLIEEYNNISGTKANKAQLSENQLNEIKKQIELVDETKVTTEVTDVAITSGIEIYVYNSEGRKIMLKDFYSDNYSEASKIIFNILKDNDLLYNQSIYIL